MNKLIKLLPILLSLSPGPLLAQVPGIPTSPSPEAMRMISFDEAPVDLYTGNPDIHIPLWKIKSVGLEIPLLLAYHTSELKVAREASAVGLGWALMAGGLITRTMHGLPDEKSGRGYLNNEPLIPDPSGDPNNLSYAVKRLCADGMLDLEPDVFNVSAPGLQCRVVFANEPGLGTMSPVPIPYSNIRIQESYGSGGIVSWVITNTDGIRYYFGQLPNGRSGIETTLSPGNTTGGSAYHSAWYLLKMLSPEGSDSIEFHYDEPYLASHSGRVTIMSFPLSSCQGGGSTHDIPMANSSGKRLSKVSWPGGRVLLKYHTNRADVSYTEAMLDSVVVLGRSGGRIRSFALYHSYFQSQGCSGTQAYQCKRLRLDSVAELSPSNQALPAYSISYHPGTLPAKNSNAIDHWGYYNGAGQNQTLVPSFNAAGIQFQGANRDCNAGTVMYSAISSLRNPLGGIITYEWEAHDYRFTSSSPTSNLVLKNESLSKTVQGTAASIGGDTLEVPFTLSHGQNINFSKTFTQAQALSCESYAEIVDVNGQIPMVIEATTSQQPFYLSGGAYTLRMIYFPSESMHISLSWQNYVINQDSTIINANRIGGGLRIASITRQDAVNPGITRKFEYKMADGSSSGVLVQGEPVYQYINYVPIVLNSQHGLPLISNVCSYLNIFSSDLVQSSSSAQGPVVYRQVKELLGQQAEFGSTESSFSFVPDTRVGHYPFPPSTGRGFQRGFLTEVKVRNANGLMRKQENYSYSYKPAENISGIKGIKIGWLERSIGPAYDRFQSSIYTFDCGHMQLDSQVVREYDDLGVAYVQHAKKLNYKSSMHQKPVSIRSYFADGTQELQKLTYTEDLLNSSNMVLNQVSYGTAHRNLLQTGMTLLNNTLESSPVMGSTSLQQAESILNQLALNQIPLLDSMANRPGRFRIQLNSSGQAANAAEALLNLNILSQVWLDETYVTEGSNYYLKSGSVFEQKQFMPGLIRSSSLRQNADHSQVQVSLPGLRLDNSGALLSSYPCIELAQMYQYDALGRLIDGGESDGRRVLLAYSQPIQFPSLIVRGEPILKSSSFDGLSTGMPAIGSPALQSVGRLDTAYNCQSSPLIIPNLPSGSYRLLLRSKGMGGLPQLLAGGMAVSWQDIGTDRNGWQWRQAGFELSNTAIISISGNCLIDDLILTHSGNQIEYRKFDDSGNISLEIIDTQPWREYEYDGFGRLVGSYDLQGRVRASWEHKVSGK